MPLPGPISDIATIQANHLFFKPQGASDLTVSGKLGAFVFTKGQPVGDRSLEDNTLIINAGRKKSTPPADFLKRGLTSDNMAVNVGSAQEPSELHFTQEIDTLEFVVSREAFTCRGIRLGQGHGGLSINWWIAQAGAQKDGPNGLALDCEGDKSSCTILAFQVAGFNAGREFKFAIVCDDVAARGR
jgi:hypothetical protein